MVFGINAGAGLDRMLNGSGGTQINRMLDALGLPDSMGDIIGAQIDAASGDVGGFARNMFDLSSGLATGTVDALFGKGLAGPHFAPRPHITLPKGRRLWGRKFYTPFGTHSISRERLGPKGPFGRLIGRSMERALLTNPAFRARMEAKLGGRIIPDGRADGKITVHRFKPHFPGVPFTNHIANNPMLTNIYGGIARMQGNIKAMMEKMLNKGANKAGGNPSSILKDPEMGKLAGQMGISAPMSFEDILFLMMLKYAKNKEKQILDKSKELLAKSEKSKKSGYNAMDSKQSDATDQAVLQKMMNDLQKVYQLLTNVMKSMHDMQMASVRNIR